MDWIERFFHVSPDSGSGSLEVGIVAGVAVALAMVLTGFVGLRARRRRRRLGDVNSSRASAKESL